MCIGNQFQSTTFLGFRMDPYTTKLTEMRGYVPFLNKMISKLELAGDPTKNDQVAMLQNCFSLSTMPPIFKLFVIGKCFSFFESTHR